MKQLTLLLTLMLLVLGACRLEELFPDVKNCAPNTFERTYNEESDYRAFEIAPVDNSTFMICGTTGTGQVFFTQIDTLGIKKSHQLNTETGISVNAMLPTDGGQFIICGSKDDNVYLGLYNEQGNAITSFKGSDISNCYDIILADNGTYIFVGNWGKPNDLSEPYMYRDDIYIGQAKISSNSIEVIKEYFSDKVSGSQRMTAISRNANGELLVGGHWEEPEVWNTYFLRMNDTLGFINDTIVSYASNLEIFVQDMISIPGNDHLVVGYLKDVSINNAALETTAFRVDANGDIQGNTPNRHSNGNLNSWGISLTPALESNKYILTGYREIADNMYKGYLAKIDNNGNIGWENPYGTPDTRLYATVPYLGNCSESYISVGYSGTTNSHEVFVIKTDTDGIIE